MRTSAGRAVLSLGCCSLMLSVGQGEGFAVEPVHPDLFRTDTATVTVDAPPRPPLLDRLAFRSGDPGIPGIPVTHDGGSVFAEAVAATVSVVREEVPEKARRRRAAPRTPPASQASLSQADTQSPPVRTGAMPAGAGAFAAGAGALLQSFQDQASMAADRIGSVAATVARARRVGPSSRAGGPDRAGVPLGAVSLLSEVRKVPVGNDARRARVIELLRRAGAPADYIRVEPIPLAASGSARAEANVIAVLGGTDPEAGTIVLGAHTDALDGSSGAVDDWTGAVMLAALYRECARARPRHDIVFVGFASEEHGQQGSRHFVETLSAGGLKRIRAMINLECLGVGTLRTWANQSSDALEHLLLSAASAEGIPAEPQVLFGYRADSLSFVHRGVPAITVHSLGPRKLAAINSREDSVALVDAGRYLDTWRVLTRYLRSVDALAEAPAAEDAERRFEPVPDSFYHCLEEAPGGIVVRRVPGGSPEARAGLRAGDLLTRVAGTPVSCRRDLLPALLTLHTGRPLEVTVQRGSGRSVRLANVTVLY